MKLTGDSRRDYEKINSENIQLKDRVLGYQEQIHSLQQSLKKAIKTKDKMKHDYEEEIAKKDAVIKELSNRLAHAEALLNHDSTNTGTPTSQTPPEKEKRIPNSRRSTGKQKGGQPGHKKHILEPPDESEVTETVVHDGGDEGLACPDCDSSNYIPTGEMEVKYEYDVQIKVAKVRHEFHLYECSECGAVFRSKIPPNLKEEVQYGSTVQALALSLMNTTNAAMNKVSMFFSGITCGELEPCEGYIAKLQARGAKHLLQFREDLKMLLICEMIVYWDDTVIKIMTQRACLRFYGNETIAYYTAHMSKDMASIDDDGILEMLTSETKAMHDHNTLNYNKKFCFINIECNQHLQRDLQKSSDNTCHEWSGELKGLISKTIMDRNGSIRRGEDSFDDTYIESFNNTVDELIKKGWDENEKDPDNYGSPFEATLLRRIEKYRKNYFMWVEDFTLPTTNNLSERGLRGVKSHMKISGQFESETAADNYALIRTYIETCRRNAFNEVDALQRLCEGNPYTVDEIFSK